MTAHHVEPLTEQERSKVREIRTAILTMLAERHELSGAHESLVNPSDYWTDFCSFFDYMLKMEEGAFNRLRLHTYHLTGDNYLTYYMDPGAGAARFLGAWERQVAALPPELVLSEPDSGIGFRAKDGRLVSVDITRYQHVVNTLHRAGALERLREKDGRKFVLEIGSGYGGLVHHLAKLVGDTTFVLVDLPETLLFAASYLALNNPDSRIWMYSPERVGDLQDPEALRQYDFVCVPNYRLGALAQLRFDLAINVASLQEMRSAQVEEYLDFLQATCSGPFYSWNRESANPINRELDSLTEMIASRFRIEEVASAPAQPKGLKSRVRSALRGLAVRAGLAEPEKPAAAGRKRELICYPRS